MNKTELLPRLQPEIELVDEAMHSDLQALAGRGVIPPNLAEVLEHALFNGGKRIRPLLCILSAALCGNRSKAVYPLALAFEYLHVATLLHDDVIDHADARRGRPAANTVFGLSRVILAGDFLHARSMYLVGSVGGKRSLELICGATEAMVAGEFLQLAIARNFNQSETDYFAVINGKTALFIGAVCEIGGIFAGAGAPEIAALKTYGANLGTAFQIQDDLLDYLGDPARTGKTIGNDFCEGKMTLPLLHALRSTGETERIFLRTLLEGDKASRCAEFPRVRDIIADSGGFYYGRQLAEKLTAAAIGALDIFQAGHDAQTADILAGLARYVIRRDR